MESSKREDARRANSPGEKRRKAIELLEGVLANAQQISPSDYGLLVQADGATLLWQFDKKRAVSILTSVLNALQDLVDEFEKSGVTDRPREAALQRLRFLAFHRIARLKPELLQTLVTSRLPLDRLVEAITQETEEARATISAASELLAKDPKLAVTVAEQSLSLGRVDWSPFLRSLSERDSGEAERLAFVLITRFRDSSVSPVALMESFRIFALMPGRSSKLRDHFFESLVIRLRRDIQPDQPADDLRADLYLARSAARLAATSSPRWLPEIENIISGFEGLFTARALPLPSAQRTRMLAGAPDVAIPGDTDEIGDALRQAATIRDSRAQDKAYQALAVKAALKANSGLAEDILFKIRSEAVRRATTLQMYGPLVRKAIDEKDWAEAQKYASRILDPLGRTMVLDNVARAMSRAGAERSLVKDVYWLAATRLDREMPPSRAVAQAYLVISQSLLPSDLEAGIGAANSAVDTLNRLSSTLEGIEEPPMASDLGMWTPVPHFYSTSPGEILDVTALIENVFAEIAKRDSEKALAVASRLAHRSTISFAHLAICKQLLAESNRSSAASKPTNRIKN